MSPSIPERVASLRTQATGAPTLKARRASFVPETRDGFPHPGPDAVYVNRWNERIIPNIYCMAFFFEQLAESLGLALSTPPAKDMTWEQKHYIQKEIIGEAETHGYDYKARNTIGCSGVARETAVMGMAIVEEIVKALGLETDIQGKGQDFLLDIASFAFREVGRVLNYDRVQLNIDAQYEAIANDIIYKTLLT
ncbi:MAG: hypothetical protein NT099_05795 [Candidatus Saganbacteria bacterium]|nr:hypothetical protein [Candidatus Saganbacteria bacterium]